MFIIMEVPSCYKEMGLEGVCCKSDPICYQDRGVEGVVREIPSDTRTEGWNVL